MFPFIYRTLKKERTKERKKKVIERDISKQIDKKREILYRKNRKRDGWFIPVYIVFVPLIIGHTLFITCKLLHFLQII